MPLQEIELEIPLPDRRIIGASAALTPDAPLLVLFAHGAGSSRMSPRNRAVARFLREAGLATILIDLLTSHEEEVDLLTAEHRFDIPMLATRVTHAADWLAQFPQSAHLPLALFGASTGAAAALIAAANRPERVRSVVSRGGRPDLAADALPNVHAPTLLIVGSLDTEVIQLNRQAAQRLTCPNQLTLVEGATHLFEEPGKLEEVSQQARDWFLQHP